MRPLRLLLDGFGSYRLPAEADFTGVDFFALTGPTGSGKSTLIDGLCFALYGTVPRWGKENAIAQALAPAANAGSVCLVFEAAGKRYAAVRALTRDKKNVVHTKEARLELLDRSIPPDAPIADILAASIEQLAEGPDQVKAGVQDILGLTYEHFTQSVLLPQGRFSEFLHAKASERQDLLVELLAFGVYTQVGQRARERAKLAADQARSAVRERADLASATGEAEAAAAGRVVALTALASTVEQQLAALSQVREEAREADQQALRLREESALLATLRIPATVPGLAGQIAEADRLVITRRKQRDDAGLTEAAAEHAREALPEKSAMEALRQAYAEHEELSAQLAIDSRALTTAQAAEEATARAGQVAEQQSEHSQNALASARQAHAAIAIAGTLHAGDSCPVCLQKITAVPEHAAPADLATATTAAQSDTVAHKRATAAHATAAATLAAARSTAASTGQRLEKIITSLAGAPGQTEILASLQAITAADEALRQARQAAAAGRRLASEAETARTALDGSERKARAELHSARDSVVPLGAPPVSDPDLAAAWQALSSWARAQYGERGRQQPDLDAAAASLRERAAADAARLIGLLAGHGITGLPDPARAPAAVAEHRVRAEKDLETVRRARKRAAELDARIGACREEEQVATQLGQLLRATSFERWLCSEALDSLVREASATLMELSDGQYQLDRDERNELSVIDFKDAGARRPVNTLSGGETFQASLALALALSRQVVGLSAGMRDLNSVFLDEGFGTLDEHTLETVATTLEQLASGSDAMVGIITHVAALADRVPVRFVVSRTGTSSVLRRERA
jgi:exonuclease SbcC